MRKTRKVLSLALAVLMLVSCLCINIVPIKADAAENWWMPLTSYASIGDPFGCTCYYHKGNHSGQDFPAGGGTTVRASKSGTVVAVVTNCRGSHLNGACNCGSSWGNYVKIKHDDGFYSLYAHLSSVSMSNGQRVSQGQKVGGVGTTGDSTGNHLHFEVYNTSNVRVNPMNYINPNNPSPSGSHTHIYDVHYEADHPHRDYKKCSCGDWYYTGTTHDTYNWHYEGDHPHRAYKTCWCGDWHYTGETVYVSSCSTCKHSHSYSSKVTKQATCTSTGTKTFVCSCGSSYTETIAKTPHNSNTSIPAVASTCTKTGLTEGKKCSVCGTVTVAQQTVAMKTHNSNTTIPAVANTCTKTGLTEGKKCSTCGTVTVAQQTVAVKSHKDDNQDYECDYGCGYEFEKPEPETPSIDCPCNCHKGGIVGFFFKLINFFEKIFGINKVCDCGKAH